MKGFFFSFFAAFPPDQPNIIDLNNYTETELPSPLLQLTWDEPDNKGRPIKHYLVWYRLLNSAANSFEVKWKNVMVRIQSFNFTSLLWGTSYEFAVTAVNDQGESSRNKTKEYDVPLGRFAVFVSYVEYLTKHVINN